jgi:PAS domain S-box-containing protein
MENFFGIPKFENEEQNVKARLISLVSVGMTIASLMFVIVSAFAMPNLLRRALALVALIIPGNLAIIWLVRSARLRAASGLLLVILWSAVTLGVLTAGGVSAPIAFGYIFSITLSGLLVSRRTSVYITAGCVMVGILLAWAEMNGWLPPAKYYSPIERISIYSFFFILTLMLQNITAGNIQHLLRQAKESESKYKSFLESIPTITYINSIKSEANTEYVSPQVKHLLGYSQEEFLKDSIFWQKIIHPEDRERVMAENSSTVQTGSPFQAEYRLFTRDQKVVWVRDEAILVRDEEGKPQYWLGVWTDITTRKHAEEEQTELIGVMTRRTIQLQTAAEVSRAASSILDINILLPNVVELIRNHFEYYYVGIFLVEESRNWAVLKAATGEMGRRMILTNHRLPVGDSSMVGWCIAHGQARIALDVGVDAVQFRNPYLPLTRSEMALPLITHSDVIGAMTIQSTAAAAFSSVDITALQTMADQVANAIENARLFTERNSLINELEKRNAELERFTYTVSHDLRSPLVTMRGFLGYLRQDATSGDLARFDKDLDRIGNAVDKMQSLLNDLLELSRVGRIINPSIDIPFRQIVDETIDLLINPLDAGKIKLQIQEELPTIHGDHTRLIEIMQNLISNAVKFMGNQPNPMIEIGSNGFDTDGKPILFVRDNGVGIEPEYHERIFGLFNRLNPEIEGTGIGLTLVRRIVEVHGGKIWIESQPGHGATFLFTLPLANPQ